jgi:hypothetical protein
MSHYVAAIAVGEQLANATAFVASYEGINYLVTNWHVATGRDPTDGRCKSPGGAVPDELAVLHLVNDAPQDDLVWRFHHHALYDDDGEPLWLEHPEHGRKVDIVALPFTDAVGLDIYAYDLESPGPDISFGPSDGVSVVGFPFGETGEGGLGIWVQGTLATEPGINFGELPCFLIDSRTREGQSGSPVIVYRTNGYATQGGDLVNNGVPATLFVGVYSGRINSESDLGFVWRAEALVETIRANMRGSFPRADPS